MSAKALIEKIGLPLMADPGEPITGTITLKNIGDMVTSAEAGYFGVLVTTLWDGKEYTLFTYSITEPGGSFIFDFHAGTPIGVMPDGDAEMEIVGRTWFGLDGVWRVDDTKSWIIGPLPPPISLWKVAAVGVSILTAVAAIFRVKKRR